LIAIAFGAFHIVRSRARERLGLSCGLRGNGMCFSSALLTEVPHEAFSIVEDVEYGIRLGERGYAVRYADEAHVYGEMVSTAAAASSQRRRWEEGRKELVRRNGPRLLRAGVAKRNKVMFDLGVDLILPPLSRVAVLSVLGLCAALAFCWWFHALALSVFSFGFAVFAVVSYVLRGWSVSQTGLRGLLDLGLARYTSSGRPACACERPRAPRRVGFARSARNNRTELWARGSRGGPRVARNPLPPPPAFDVSSRPHDSRTK